MATLADYQDALAHETDEAERYHARAATARKEHRNREALIYEQSAYVRERMASTYLRIISDLATEEQQA